MNFKSIVLACLLKVIVAEVIDLHYTSVLTGATGSFGVLQYEKGAKRTGFELASGIENGEYCIGTKALADHDCFAYLKVELESDLSNKNIQLHLDELNEIKQLALVELKQVLVRHVGRISQPNLNPAHASTVKKSGKVEHVIEKQVIVEIDEEGNEVEREIDVEVEVDGRSWIQKNWIWLVVPLLFVMLLPEDKEKKAA